MSSRTRADLEEKLEEAAVSINQARRAVGIEAPELAAAHLRQALQSAQGKLMEADDLARIHIRDLEARLKE